LDSTDAISCVKENDLKELCLLTNKDNKYKKIIVRYFIMYFSGKRKKII